MLANPKLHNLADAMKRREQLRAERKTVVLTNGVFDLLHAGHLHYLRAAAGRGGALFIALNGDAPERSHASARTFPGNFLFSTGPNTQGGGKRRTKGHYDVPMRDCTVLLDNATVIERGKFVDPAMIVQRETR